MSFILWSLNSIDGNLKEVLQTIIQKVYLILDIVGVTINDFKDYITSKQIILNNYNKGAIGYIIASYCMKLDTFNTFDEL